MHACTISGDPPVDRGEGGAYINSTGLYHLANLVDNQLGFVNRPTIRFGGVVLACVAGATVLLLLEVRR